MFRSKTKDLIELAGFRKRRWYERKPKTYTHRFVITGDPSVSKETLDFMNRHQFHLFPSGNYLMVWRIFPYNEGLPITRG